MFFGMEVVVAVGGRLEGGCEEWRGGGMEGGWRWRRKGEEVAGEVGGVVAGAESGAMVGDIEGAGRGRWVGGMEGGMGRSG